MPDWVSPRLASSISSTVFDSSFKTMKRTMAAGAVLIFVFVTLARAQSNASSPSSTSSPSSEDPLDLKSIPIADWLDQGEHMQIPWEFRVNEPYLRVDQRMEVAYVSSF